MTKRIETASPAREDIAVFRVTVADLDSLAGRWIEAQP